MFGKVTASVWEEAAPPASRTLRLQTKRRNERPRSRREKSAAQPGFSLRSCGTGRLMKASCRRLARAPGLWQDSLKAGALVYQFILPSQKMRGRALQRSGLFYLTSKSSQPTPLSSFFYLSHHALLLLLLCFKCEVKVCVNICRASFSLNVENKSSRLILYPVVSPFFPSLLNGTAPTSTTTTTTTAAATPGGCVHTE